MENNDFTKEIDLGLAKIVTMANIINRKTELCCEVNDCGQIRELRVSVYQNCKEIWNQTPCKFVLSYQDRPYDKDSKHRLDRINDCIEFLETCMNDNKIPFGMCDEIKEYVTTGYRI